MILKNDFEQILYREMKASFSFLYDNANKKEGSKGFGLTLDRYVEKDNCSIASVGFLLGGIKTAIDEAFISKEEARAYVSGTLHTLLHNVDHYKGMFAHFVEMETGKRMYNCEYSTIDTMLLLAGALCNIGLFDEEVDEQIEKLLERADYTSYMRQKADGNYAISMAYNEHATHQDDYEENGFNKTNWDFMAEHLALYFIVAGHKNVDPEIARNLYYTMERTIGAYKGEPFIFEDGGSLFIHQYSHTFVDFRNYVDGHGFDWFENSKRASLANYQYCIDFKDSKTYSRYLWGTTACQAPSGYVVNGSMPNNRKGSSKKPRMEGTFTPCGPIGSVVFVPELVEETIAHLEKEYPQLVGPFGYYDGLNLDAEEIIVKDYIGINKGITLLMTANYFNGNVWDQFMNTKWIQRGIKVLGFQTRN